MVVEAVSLSYSVVLFDNRLGLAVCEDEDLRRLTAKAHKDLIFSNRETVLGKRLLTRLPDKPVHDVFMGRRLILRRFGHNLCRWCVTNFIQLLLHTAASSGWVSLYGSVLLLCLFRSRCVSSLLRLHRRDLSRPCLLFFLLAVSITHNVKSNIEDMTYFFYQPLTENLRE